MRDQQGSTRFLSIAVASVLIIIGCIFYVVFRKQATLNNISGKTAVESVSENVKKQTGDSWEARIEAALKSFDCPDFSKPQWDSSQYQGPLIDTHFHISTIPDANPDGPEDWKEEKFYTSPGVNMAMSDYICTLKNDGTSGKVFAFFPVYPNIEWQSLKLVKRTMERYPDTFVPFINAPDGDLGSVDGPTLKRMLGAYPGLFKGFGEQGLYAAAAPELPPDSKRMLGTYPVVRENNLVIYFHLGVGQEDSWEKILKANRDITFIWHGDNLAINPQVGRSSLKIIEGILSRNPNVYYGVDELYGDIVLINTESNAKKAVSYIKENKESLLKKDLATWKGFIEDHPDQVIWGTDRGSYLYSLDIELGRAMSDYTRAFIAGLDPSVREKFAYKNAERLISKNLKNKNF
jgi:predicted TIM-barrel fold metal-dependent hydrolase